MVPYLTDRRCLTPFAGPSRLRSLLLSCHLYLVMSSCPIGAPLITACICTRDRAELLVDALASLERQTMGPSPAHILVIDTSESASARHVADEASAHHALDYRAVGPIGLSAGRNRALRYCNTEYIAFMDDDARAEPDWLERMIEVFRRHPDTAVAGGPVRPIWETGPPSWLPESYLGYLSILDRGERERELDDDEWLCGTNLALHTRTAREQGGFRTDLGRRPGTLLGNEELELCRRLESLGKRVVYSPFPAVRHLVPAERCTQAWLRERVAWQGLSDLLMIEPLSVRAELLINSMREFFENGSGRPEACGSLFRDVRHAHEFKTQCEVILTRVARMGSEELTARQAFRYDPPDD